MAEENIETATEQDVFLASLEDNVAEETTKEEVSTQKASSKSKKEAKVSEKIVEQTPIKEEVATKEQESNFDDIIPLEEDEKEVEDDFEFPQEFDKILEERYSDIGLKSGKDLETIISEFSKTRDENVELKAKLEEATKKANPFENEAQKKLFEFAKQYDGTNSKVLAEFEHLQSLDVSKMTEKEVLKELFVQENKNFGRAKAERMFELDYEDTYDIENLDEDYDTKEIEKRTLRLERAAAKAKKQLVELIENFKPDVSQNVNTVENAKVTKAIERTLENAEAEMLKIKTLEFVLGDDPADKFVIGLNEKQQAHVMNRVTAILSNPQNYDKDGKLNNGVTPQSLYRLIARSDFQDLIDKKIYGRGKQVLTIQNVTEKAPKSQKPLTSNGASNSMPKTDQEAFLASLLN